MSTIQEQKKKQLTFEEICPKWSYYYKRLLSIQGVTCRHDDYKPQQQLEINLELGRLGLDITSCKTCIVGEAYGFSSSYGTDGSNYCRECEQFAMEDVFEYKQSHLDGFVQHWNEVHLNK